MHSVAIYGDHRRHSYQNRKPPVQTTTQSAGWFDGGVYLMAEAVGRMLESLRFDDTDHPEPEVFTFDPRTLKDPEATGFERMEWILQGTRLDDQPADAEEKLRLVDPTTSDPPDPGPPRLGGNFGRALERFVPGRPTPPAGEPLPPGYFDPPTRPRAGAGPAGPATEPVRTPYCPDIVLFDDLGGQIRKAVLPEVAVSPGGVAEWRAGAYAAPGTKDDARAQYAEGLAILLSRLRHAAGPANQTDLGAPALEPVIICSVQGVRPPDLDAAAKAPNTFWGAFAADRNLLRRTILILDAADLREHAGLAISTGLSWEATAQDTLYELRRPKFARLLEFAQVVVRFGYAAALHVSRGDDREWHHQLYYDPTRDDTVWTDPRKNGHVLGQSAVFAAAVVRHLTRVCLERREQPVLLDLMAAVGGALPDAIRTAQRLMQYGYGTDQEPLWPRGQKEPSAAFPDEVFESDPTSLVVASSPISAFRNRSWSILGQAVQGRVGTVARDIVLHGVERALVQSVPTLGQFTDALTDEVQDAIDDTAEKVFAFPDDPRQVGPGLDGRLAHYLLEVVGGEARQVLRSLLRLPPDGVDDLVEESARLVEGVAPRLVGELRQLWKLNRLTFSKNKELYAGVEQAAVRVARQLGREVHRNLDLPFADDPRWRPVAAPVYAVGKRLRVVDRREIEGVRNVRKLIGSHLEAASTEYEPDRVPPLSLAVFGPPGAGKSSTVRAVLEGFKGHPARPELLKPFNLAQFSTTADLDRAFDEIVNSIAENHVPIAFFDEFDSRYEDEQWGWLKFFLSPMEDGRYRGKPVHKTVFVFAGGTSPNYAEFSLRNRPRTDPLYQDFVRAKGPDFVSRLMGHLDIVGVNSLDSDDSLYLVRRAVVIRSILADIQKLDAQGKARVQDNILRALLFVPTYHNGARSIHKLIKMCRGAARELVSADLPPINQLNMVTDGNSFHDLLNGVDMNGA